MDTIRRTVVIDIDPGRADDKSILRPRWRLPLILAAGVVAMLLWLVLKHIR